MHLDGLDERWLIWILLRGSLGCRLGHRRLMIGWHCQAGGVAGARLGTQLIETLSGHLGRRVGGD